MGGVGGRNGKNFADVGIRFCLMRRQRILRSVLANVVKHVTRCLGNSPITVRPFLRIASACNRLSEDA